MIRELPFCKLNDKEKAELMWAWHLGLPFQFRADDDDIYWYTDDDPRNDRTNAPDYYINLVYRITPK